VVFQDCFYVNGVGDALQQEALKNQEIKNFP
jgi:hypothetical protein